MVALPLWQVLGLGPAVSVSGILVLAGGYLVRIREATEPAEGEQARVTADQAPHPSSEPLVVRDPGPPREHQPAVAWRPGRRLRFVGVLMLYPDRLVHVRASFPNRGVSMRIRRRIAESHRSVTSIALDTVQRIEHPTRNPKTDGVAVITDAGEEYWFRGTSGEGGCPLDFDEWAANLYTALGKLGRDVPPPTIEERPSSPLPGTSPMGAVAVALYGLAAGGAAAAAYTALVVATGEEQFYLLAIVGLAVGMAVGYGPPWMSRMPLAVVGALIGLIATAAAPYAIIRHYRDPLTLYSTLDVAFLAGSIGFSVLLAALVPLQDYDLRIFRYLQRPRRSRALVVAAAVTAGVLLMASVGALLVMATPVD